MPGLVKHHVLEQLSGHVNELVAMAFLPVPLLAESASSSNTLDCTVSSANTVDAGRPHTIALAINVFAT